MTTFRGGPIDGQSTDEECLGRRWVMPIGHNPPEEFPWVRFDQALYARSGDYIETVEGDWVHLFTGEARA